MWKAQRNKERKRLRRMKMFNDRIKQLHNAQEKSNIDNIPEDKHDIHSKQSHHDHQTTNDENSEYYVQNNSNAIIP